MLYWPILKNELKRFCIFRTISEIQKLTTKIRNDILQLKISNQLKRSYRKSKKQIFIFYHLLTKRGKKCIIKQFNNII